MRGLHDVNITNVSSVSAICLKRKNKNSYPKEFLRKKKKTVLLKYLKI